MGVDWSAADDLMAAATEDGTTPGAVLLVGRGHEVVFERAYGLLEDGGQPVTTETIYDLASLTKPLVTTACMLILATDGRLDLDQLATDWLPALVAGDEDGLRGRIRLADLLGHRSGLPAWRPYFEMTEPGAPCAGAIIAAAAAEPLEYRPGAASVYSDVGFILLGPVIEAASGQSLAEFASSRLLEPLGAGRATFVDVASGARLGPGGVAPCGHSPWRGEVVRGVPSDDNAFAMGGAAGHAGLFAGAREVHLLLAEHVAAFGGHGTVLDTGLVRRCWTETSLAGSSWKIGWDGPSPEGSSAGRHVSGAAVGHLGWTGGSVWVDPGRGVHVVLLTNRVHPDQGNKGIEVLRPALHDAVFEALDA